MLFLLLPLILLAPILCFICAGPSKARDARQSRPNLKEPPTQEKKSGEKVEESRQAELVSAKSLKKDESSLSQWSFSKSDKGALMTEEKESRENILVEHFKKADKSAEPEYVDLDMIPTIETIEEKTKEVKTSRPISDGEA